MILNLEDIKRMTSNIISNIESFGIRVNPNSKKVNDDKIIHYSTFKSNDPSRNFYVYNYIFISDLKEDEYVLQKEEVERVKYFEIEELEQYKKENNPEYSFSKWEQGDFDYQMDLLKEYRSNLSK